MLARGQLKLAVTTAIEARGNEWWTREQIRDDVRALGIETSDDAINTTVWQWKSTQSVERRVMPGKAGREEYRVKPPETGQPPALPVDPAMSRERKHRQVEDRHSDRPTAWEREAEAISKAIVEQPPYTVTVAPSPPVEVLPPKQGKVVHFQRYEEVTGEPVMTPTNGHAKELFVLKSDRLLNDLERSMTQLVQEAIKSAREQIAKLVEEELR